MSGVALPGDVEWTAFVFREALQPVNQEQIRVISCSLVSTEVIIGGCVGVRVSDTRRRFQEDHICHYTCFFLIPPLERVSIHIYMQIVHEFPT